MCECGIDLGKEIIPELITLLKDPYRDVRSNAAITLRLFGESSKEAIPQLLILLKDPSRKVYRNAASTLGNMGQFRKEVISQLIGLLKNPNAEIRRNAVYALGNMGESAIIAIPDLNKALEDSDKEVRETSTIALIEVSKKLKEMQGSLSSPELNKAISGFEKTLNLLENKKDQSHKIQENLTSLANERDHRLWNLFVDKTKKDPNFFALLILGLIVIPVLPIAYRITLAQSPLLLLQIPSEILGKFKIPIGFLLKLKYHPKVLNAWASKYLGSDIHISTEQDRAKIRFWDNATAKLHHPSRYIPLPLRIETSSQSGRYESLPLELLQEIFQQNTVQLLIYGEGGIGKTSLVCKLAESVMAGQLLHKKHALLPILIEPEQIEQELKLNKPMPIEVTKKDADNSYKTLDIDISQPFIEAIRKQLQHLINEQEPISDELLKQLLQSGHILVIIDRFSEMSENARQTITPASKTHPINALIVTSRKYETFDNFKMNVIKPLQLTGSELMRFMEAYFEKDQQVPLNQQPLLYQACDNLQNIVKVHDKRTIITVLFAKLAADQLIAKKPLPTSIPNLIINSLDLLNDQVSTQEYKPSNKTIQSDIQLIAWECLKSTFYPNTATLENITKALEKLDPENEPHQRLNYLISKLRVVEVVSSTTDQVRIFLDPMAEYLAGLHLLKMYGDSVWQWKDFMKRVDESKNDTTKEFILAVYDCCHDAGFEGIVNLFKPYFDQNLEDKFNS
jgi:HEAT repeat protein